MAAADRNDAYASALFEVARAEGNLDRVEDELYQVARAIEGSEELRSKLTDQALPVELRQGIVEDLLGGRRSPTTKASSRFVVGAGRGRDLPAIIDLMVQPLGRRRGPRPWPRSVRPSPSTTTSSVVSPPPSAPARVRRCRCKVSVDPTILGGIVATIGDTVIDGTSDAASTS